MFLKKQHCLHVILKKAIAFVKYIYVYKCLTQDIILNAGDLYAERIKITICVPNCLLGMNSMSLFIITMVDVKYLKMQVNDLLSFLVFKEEISPT